jgi:hypothetical protein
MNVITANRLDDGLVVFLDAASSWTTVLAEARRLADAEEIDEALAIARASAARHEILDPYAVVVTEAEGRLVPKEIKERIRAFGPTVASNFPDQVRARKAAE